MQIDNSHLCNRVSISLWPNFLRFDLKYLKEAFKEPINFWGMAGFAVAAAYVQDVTPLVAASGNRNTLLGRRACKFYLSTSG